MKLKELTTINQLADFLSGAQSVAFTVVDNKDACYRWIQGELAKFSYMTLSKSDKGVVIQYLMKISGYSRQQITRLIKQYKTRGRLRRRQRTVAGFKTKYTEQDIGLLAEMDKRHETPCGQVIKKLCERANTVFGEDEYANLSEISVSHLYNLRKTSVYVGKRRHFEKTKSKPSTIGERRKPQPNQQPGYIHIDTVHQGDLDKKKGVYHINAVDEETQYEIVCTVEKISERYLIPVLEAMLEAFPFVIKGFHADNGSEYINRHVVKLLEKLRIELTKSRARQSNDNALVESKNGFVIRKIFGYDHIQQRWAPLINEFNMNYLNDYLNYHRPCFLLKQNGIKKGKR
ncbi:MAG: transposase family protein [Pseudomonadales bacterium]|nr:transposase family protein [Pseudomonadales bacterium]